MPCLLTLLPPAQSPCFPLRKMHVSSASFFTCSCIPWRNCPSLAVLWSNGQWKFLQQYGNCVEEGSAELHRNSLSHEYELALYLVVVGGSWWASCCAHKNACLVVLLLGLYPHHWVTMLRSPSAPQTWPRSPLTTGTAAVWHSSLSLFSYVFTGKEAMKEVWQLQIGLPPTFNLSHLSLAQICCHIFVLLLLCAFMYPSKMLVVFFHKYFFILSSCRHP